MTCLTLCIDQAFHDHLCRDTCVIRASLPEGVIALHTVVADQGIHDRVLEGMAHMQAACDIWRGDHDAVRGAFTTGGKVALVFPGLVPGLLYGVGVVSLFHEIFKERLRESRRL